MQVSWKFNYWPLWADMSLLQHTTSWGSSFEVMLRMQKWGSEESKPGKGGEPTKGPLRAGYHCEHQGLHPSKDSQRNGVDSNPELSQSGLSRLATDLQIPSSVSLFLLMVPELLKPGHFQAALLMAKESSRALVAFSGRKAESYRWGGKLLWVGSCQCVLSCSLSEAGQGEATGSTPHTTYFF